MIFILHEGLLVPGGGHCGMLQFQVTPNDSLKYHQLTSTWWQGLAGEI